MSWKSPRLCARARRQLSTRHLPRSTPSVVRSSLRRSRGAVLSNVNAARGAPQTLEVIIMARAFSEDMHDEAAEIQQHPFGAGFAFAMHQMHADPRELPFNLIANGIHLRRAESRADQKAIGERAQPLKIKQRYLRRLLFLRRGDGHAKF